MISGSSTCFSSVIPRSLLRGASFYDAGLLDELIIQIGSATLGKGKPLFPRRVLSQNLCLVFVRQFGVGMAELRYDVHKGSAVAAV